MRTEHAIEHVSPPRRPAKEVQKRPISKTKGAARVASRYYIIHVAHPGIPGEEFYMGCNLVVDFSR